MNVTVVSPHALTQLERLKWLELTGSHASLASPFFHPVFIETVAATRGDVQVAVVREGDEIVAFFPFQRGAYQSGLPVGAGLSEFHGLIAVPDQPVDMTRLLRECGLHRWKFDHLPLAQSALSRGVTQRGESPYLDLSRGYAAYVDSKQRSGSSVVKRTERKARKLAREVGELSFVHHTDERSALDLLFSWKREQHQRTGVLDIFRYEWVCDLLRRVHGTHQDSFKGTCSTLSAGGELVAVHLGLQTQNAAHMWFVSYNRRFAQYSPGMILFLRMAEALAAERVQRLDFGPGGQRYKQSLMSASLPVGIGVLERNWFAARGRQTWAAAKSAVRATPVRYALRVPAHTMFRLQQWLAFRQPNPSTKRPTL